MSVYNQWLKASNELKKAKAKELELRLKICNEILEDKLEGTVTQFAQNKHYKVTATAKLNRTIDSGVLSAIWEDLSDEEKECVDFKPSLVLKSYRAIEGEGGKLLDAVTVKPGTPTLKIVEVVE